MNKNTITIKKDADKVTPIEVMEQSILSISNGINKLINGPLNERALVLLIQHASPKPKGFRAKPISGKEVRAVLQGIKQLSKEYLKP